MERKYVSYDKLSIFLSKLKTIFSDISHTHSVSEVDGLQDTLDGLVSQSQYTILPITQDEYDALTTVDENTLYIIEV